MLKIHQMRPSIQHQESRQRSGFVMVLSIIVLVYLNTHDKTPRVQVPLHTETLLSVCAKVFYHLGVTFAWIGRFENLKMAHFEIGSYRATISL